MRVAVSAFQASQLKDRALVPAVSQLLSKRTDGTLTLTAISIVRRWGSTRIDASWPVLVPGPGPLSTSTRIHLPYSNIPASYCTHPISTSRPCPHSIHPFFLLSRALFCSLSRLFSSSFARGPRNPELRPRIRTCWPFGGETA